MMTLAERQALDRMREAVERFASSLDEGPETEKGELPSLVNSADEWFRETDRVEAQQRVSHESWCRHLEALAVAVDSIIPTLFKITTDRRSTVVRG